MRELYVEGVAIHDGPGPCVCVREGADEALAGVHVGRAIEPRNDQFGVLTLLVERKATLGAALCELSAGPARSENLCMRGISMRENREVPCSPTADGAGGRDGKAKAVIRR
jgi:hypothetical protein